MTNNDNSDDDLTGDEWDDIVAALRVAASSIEMTAQNLTARDGVAGNLRPVQVAIRRKAARYRKLATSLAKVT